MSIQDQINPIKQHIIYPRPLCYVYPVPKRITKQMELIIFRYLKLKSV